MDTHQQRLNDAIKFREFCDYSKYRDLAEKPRYGFFAEMIERNYNKKADALAEEFPEFPEVYAFMQGAKRIGADVVVYDTITGDLTIHEIKTYKP